MCHVFSDVEWWRVNVPRVLCFRIVGGGFMCHVFSVLEWRRVYVPHVVYFRIATGLCATYTLF